MKNLFILATVIVLFTTSSCTKTTDCPLCDVNSTAITPAAGCEWHLVSNPCTGGCVVDQYNPLHTVIVEEKPSAWNAGFITAWTPTGRTLPGVFTSQNTVNQITASNFAQYGKATLWFTTYSSTENAYIIDNVSSPRQQ